MKRIISIFMLIIILSGCSNGKSHMQRALALREKLSKSSTFSFDCEITADYGERTSSFFVSCLGESSGDLSFTVLEPDTIKDITGKLASDGGKLTFDDTVLAFPMLAEGEVSPVSAPWLLIKTLLGGYISSCCIEEGMLRITMDDSYESDALHLDIWLNEKDLPERAEILWQGRRILSLIVEDFQIL